MPGTNSKFITDSCHDIGHTWNSSCSATFFDILCTSFKTSFKIYSTLYSISFIAGRKGTKYLKNRLLHEIVQSTMFLTTNAAFYCFFFCLVRKALGRFYKYSVGFIPGFLASLTAILVERKSRRGTLAIYMLNQACDTLFSALKDCGYARDVAYGEVIIFSVSMAILMHLFNAGLLPDGFVKTLLEKCFGKKVKRAANNNMLESRQAAKEEETLISEKLIIAESVLLGAKVFGIGTSLYTLYGLVLSLPKLFKKPQAYLRIFLRKDNYKFGAWLGSYVFIYNALLKLLRKHNKAGGQTNAAVAGGVAGISMLWQRSSTYSLYIMSKTIELVYMTGIEQGLLPYYKHFDSILYAVCTAIMFHSAMLQPLYLKPAYFRFLENVTGQKFATVNREKLAPFGFDSSRFDKDYALPALTKNS